MKIVTTFAAAAVAACVLTSPSLAYDLKLQFDSVHGESAQVHYGTQHISTSAGRYNWTVLEVADPGNPYGFREGQEIFTFCVELQSMGPGPHYYEFADPDKVPGSQSGMGEEKAKVLSSLYLNNFQTAKTGTKQQAAAFQMCVWEIVYETIADISKPHESLSVGGGDITIDGVLATEQLADLWLSKVVLNDKILDELLGLANGQDQMIYVPVPAPFALAGVGLLGVIFGHKRLRSLLS